MKAKARADIGGRGENASRIGGCGGTGISPPPVRSKLGTMGAGWPMMRAR